VFLVWKGGNRDNYTWSVEQVAGGSCQPLARLAPGGRRDNPSEFGVAIGRLSPLSFCRVPLARQQVTGDHADTEGHEQACERLLLHLAADGLDRTVAPGKTPETLGGVTLTKLGIH